MKRIVAIFGMPRSGTSWVSQLLDSSPDVKFRMEPIFAYAFKNEVNEHSSRDEFDNFFAKVFRADDDEFMNQKTNRALGLYPTFNKSKRPHTLVFKTSRFHQIVPTLLRLYSVQELRIVIVVRHPCGAISSWLKHPDEFPDGADPNVEWRTGSCRKSAPEEFWGFDDWKSVMTTYVELEEQHSNLKIFQYENLVENLRIEAKKLFEFSNIEDSEQSQWFINNCQRTEIANPYAVFKRPNVAFAWTKELAPNIVQTIVSEVRGTDLERFSIT